ncbi:MAG: HAD hydrolase family protein [Fimbriimonadaceae bacterium]|nr:HAD hydrolase family protein [Fimbriimonadaceae bacterium]
MEAALGRAFASELAALEDTVEWGLSCNVGPLEQFVADVADRPLIAIGSGGSSTACHLTSLLHRERHGRPAMFTTPLDILLVPAGLHRAGVFLASASGKNKDILAALDACIAEETPAIAVVVLREKSPLGEAATLFARARVFASDAPAGKDGFLATNGLLATCVLMTRAYGHQMSIPNMQGKRLEGSIFEDRHMVLVLHGGWGAPVATDLESKLNESALAATQVADYRNFGHGRHLWLAKRAAETVVVALVTPGSAAIAEPTLRLIPKSIPVVRLDTTLDGPAGTVDLLLQAFNLVHFLGETRVQDPGRPHVPEFGRKLYRLAPPRSRAAIAAPIQRKLWASPGAAGDGGVFLRGLQKFLALARTVKIGAVAIDYDGTLCSKDRRFDRLPEEVVAECARLLEAGLQLGIATGRGKSVRQELQKVFDRALWGRCHIGYYNGTDIGTLGDDDSPKTDEPIDAVLKRAQSLLSEDAWLATAAKITPRPKQLTVEPKGATRNDALAAHVMSRLAPLDGMGVRIVVSSHSLDVLGAQPGKGALVTWLRRQIGAGREVLSIGDRGAWPGNDFVLLAEPMSLSVDEVSSLDDSCWNLAPRGVSGPDATLLYLRAIKARDGLGTFTWKEGSAR